MSLLETLKSALQGEPIEDPKDREEYFDRLGIEEEKESIKDRPIFSPNTPTFPPAPPRRRTLYDHNYIPDRHSTIEQYQRRVTHYAGSREHFTTKTLSMSQNEILEKTDASGVEDAIKKSLERVLRELIREVDDILFRISDRMKGDARFPRYQSVRNGQMLTTTVEGYLLRMQDYINFGYHVEQHNSPEKFSRELRVLLFNGDTRIEYTFDIDRH